MHPQVNWDALPWQPVNPHFHRKVFGGEGVTMALHRVLAGKLPSPHSHFHEQLLWHLEGDFELQMDDTWVPLKAGDVVRIPPHMVHSGRVRSGADAVMMDVFVPRREEYEAGYAQFLASRG